MIAIGETEVAHKVLDGAGVPGGSLVERIRLLIERDDRRLELLVDFQVEKQKLRDRISRLESA